MGAIEWAALAALFLICAVAPARPSLAALPVIVLAVLNLRARDWVGLPVLLGAALAATGAASAFEGGRVGLAIQLLLSLAVFVVTRVSAQPSIERLSGALTAFFVAGAIASVLFIALAEPVIRDADSATVVESESVRLGFPVVWMGSVNHVSCAIGLGVACWVAWLSLQKRHHLGWRWIPVLSVPVVGVWAILLTGTRGSLLAVLVVALATLVARGRGFRLRAVALAGLLAVCVFAITGLLETLAVKSQIESLFPRDSGNLSGRLYIWKTARELALQRPFIGFGVGGDELWGQGFGTHNAFLAVWLGLGLLGLVGYLAWVTTCVGVGRPNGQNALATVPAILLIALLFVWSSNVFEWAAIAWGALGLCAAASRLITRDAGPHGSIRGEGGGMTDMQSPPSHLTSTGDPRV